MKLLFVVKREPQQRDLVARPYGRFHHLPRELAELGHEVTIAWIGHRGLPDREVVRDGVRGISLDLRTLGPGALLRRLGSLARDARPDWIVGASDVPQGWLARRIARDCGARLAVDAYDNFEAYMPWNLPLHLLWRRVVRDADLVTAAGPQLAARLQSHRRDGRPACVVPMAADPEFVPRDRRACRAALGLPPDAPLIGYLGSWARNRGTDQLLRAFRLLRHARPHLRLVLSGRNSAGMSTADGVLSQGYLADELLPPLVSALDVACVITAESRFGRYSYPAKLCEAMACGVPVAATATEPVRWMLGDRSTHLAVPGDAEGLAQCVSALLDAPTSDYGPLPSWRASALEFEGQLRA